MFNWVGSCWYFLCYFDFVNVELFCDKENEVYWMGLCGMCDDGCFDFGGVDLYVGGVEYVVLYLLYVWFWYKVLYDLGYVISEELFCCYFG